MIKNLLFVFIIFATLSCSKTEDTYKIALADSNPIIGLASAIQLNAMSTYFLQSEYFVLSQIDSMKVPNEMTYRINGDTIFLEGNCNEQLSTISLFKEGFPHFIPIIRSSKKEINYEFDPIGVDYKEVNLRGSFNAWNAANTPLTLEEGKWTTDLSLEGGDYEYLVVCDGVEMLDSGNEVKKDNGMGGFNSILNIALPDPIKIPSLTCTNFESGKIILSTSIEEAKILVLWNNKKIEAEHIKTIDNKIEIAIPGNAIEKERSYIRVWAYTKDGISNDIFIPLVYGKPLIDAADLHRMDKHAMSMYFLMIDRFNNGDKSIDKPVADPEIHPKANYYGGDLQGVVDKLESGYFDELGVNTIWLSPVTLNPEGAYGLYPTPLTKFSGYHGYWPIRSTVVDYRYGNLELLKKLTRLAHENNMNVLIDYVANHVHEEHPIYKNNPDWVTELYLPDGSLNTERWDDHRLTTWFDTFLPTLDLSRVEVVEPMTDSALYWLSEVGIDGFRHDATKHIPEIFWETLTRKIKKEVIIPQKREIFQIGETYGSKALINSYIGSGKLDSQFDFNVYDDAVATFARRDVPFDRLEKGLRESFEVYGYHSLMGYITGNQDRARFISYASGDVSFEEDAKLAGWTREIIISDSSAFDRLSMLHAFITTIPGIPVIYYGDEVGSPGGNDPDNRKMMKFDSLTNREEALKENLSTLFKLRNSNPSLIYGDTQFLFKENDQWAYVRSWFGENALVLFNKADESVSIDLTLPFKSRSNPEITFHKEQNIKLNGQELSIDLAPNSYEILIFKK